MREQGLPAPEPQVDILIGGRLVGRADFYWDEYGVIGEADGWDKYKNDWRKFRDQKRKDTCYERAGTVVVRWDSDEADEFAAAFAMASRAVPPASASQRRWVARRRPRF
jgi:hypothetical protein